MTFFASTLTYLANKWTELCHVVCSDQLWSNESFLCANKIQNTGKSYKFMNSSPDSDQSKETMGVKQPLSSWNGWENEHLT